MNLPAHIKHTLLQAIVLVAGLFIAIAGNAQVHVAFSGHVVMSETLPKNTTMTIVSGSDTTEMRIMPNGSFSALVSVQDSIVVTVTSPNHISEQIVIHANGSDPKLAYMQHVRFNVALDRQPADRDLVYAGPVGIIRFTGDRPAMEMIDQAKLDRATGILSASR